MKLSLIAAIALSTLMAFFAVQNSQQAHVTFMGWYFDSALVIVLLISFVVGVLSALLAMLPASVQKSILISRLKSQLSECSRKTTLLEKELADKPAPPVIQEVSTSQRDAA